MGFFSHRYIFFLQKKAVVNICIFDTSLLQHKELYILDIITIHYKTPITTGFSIVFYCDLKCVLQKNTITSVNNLVNLYCQLACGMV